MVLVLFMNVTALSGIGKQEYADTIKDGPYIFRTEQHIDAVWFDGGQIKKERLRPGNFNELKKLFNLKFSYRDLVSINFMKPDYRQNFRNVDSIAAISDIHGSFYGYLNLLKAQGIIDNNLDWSFGKGHLVVLGDIFDRGGNVTEILWHLFALEKQADHAGGKVHVLLGNHELMTFAGDLRYTDSKYLHVANAMSKSYSDLYSDSSIMGKWLRYKPVIVTINDLIFVHGGISGNLLKRNMSNAEINRLFFQMLVEKAVESKNDIRNLVLLTEDEGPVWFRGFFDDPAFNEAMTDSILRFYDKKSIIVGHTPSSQIRSLFNNKIIGIDAGLGNDLPGAILIIHGENYYIGTIDGKRKKL